MKLDNTRVAAFDEQGYLFFPGLPDDGEVAILQRAIPEILNRQGLEVIPEKEDAAAARLVTHRRISDADAAFTVEVNTRAGAGGPVGA